MRFHAILRRAVAVASLAAASLAHAQPTDDSPLARPPNGMRRVEPNFHAITDATVHPAPGVTLEHTTVVIRDGRIVSVGQAPPPAGARVWVGTGLHVYAGLIDPFIPVDAPKPDADAPGAHWNPRVTPQRRALDGEGIDKATRATLRDMGFVAAGIVPKGGDFRGTTAVVALADPSPDRSAVQPTVYRDSVFNALSFETTGFGRDPKSISYPTSHMGAVALIRQTLMDAEWARANPDLAQPDSALAALADRDRPLLFDVDHELKALNAAAIAAEAGRPAVIVGNGAGSKRLDALAATHLPMIVPLRFPATPDVTSTGHADAVGLRELIAWEQAPTNPRRLVGAGLTVALTTSKVKSRDTFTANLRKAIAFGLDPDEALAMLTTTPAAMLGVADLLGTIEPGKAASLVIADSPLFDKDRTIRDLWIDGQHIEINPPTDDDLAGTWELTKVASDDPTNIATLVLDPQHKKVSFSIPDEGEFKGRDLKITGHRVSFVLDDRSESDSDLPPILVSMLVTGDRLTGWARADEGENIAFRGTRTAGLDDDADPDEADDADDEFAAIAADVPEALGTPVGPYAMDDIPEQQTVLFTHATVWTSGPKGIIEDGSVLIDRGKVVAVGTNIGVPDGAAVIDLHGKHLTPGIIDAHSHTGLFRFGVNEGSQACTAEVRIHDDLDPGDIGFYREIASGVTIVNSLHGSANPIGGQNAIHKLRWGARHPDDMLMQGAKPGIKFALGENVKQSNWGDDYTVRYPQTRMGVESFIRDRFDAARRYEIERQHPGKGFRRDLELDALAEILQGKRLIHCHSYRQDEILMLCNIAGDYGFTIGSFQHVLEGYKVAEAIAQHALGASCFSDWWAYKVEVQDAIPSNGPIMASQGVVVSYNSDSDDLARRLNTEAAKAVHYGSMQPAEALKLITINPAIQFAIDDRVGSIEPGKDADLVIWSGDPLSTTSRCEQTWIDGRQYFSLDRDAAMRSRIADERQRIITKILTLNNTSHDREKDDEAETSDDDPDTIARNAYLDNLTAGPAHKPGDCGCSTTHTHK